MEFDAHPIVVHFPIALLISAMGFQVLSWLPKFDKCHQTSWHLLILSAVTTTAAVWTGWHEADELHLHHNILDSHRIYAFITLAVVWSGIVMLWFIRHDKRVFKVTLLILLLATSATVAITGFYGGKLVYEYGVGVKE